MNPVERIAIFRPGALGDTLLAFPALAALRARYPTAQILVVGNFDALSLAQSSGLADTIADFAAPEWATLFTETSEDLVPAALAGIDTAILWLRDPDSIVASNLRRLGVPRIIQAPGQPDVTARTHAATHLLATLQPLDIAFASLPLPPLRLPAAAEGWAADWWQAQGLMDQHVIAIHPGSGGQHKCWPAGRYAALADILTANGAAILLVAGPADTTILAALRAAQQTPPAAIAHNLPLQLLSALLRRCAAFVGNDSGVTHLSALLGLPTVAIFGPTDPAVWAPLGPHVYIVAPPAIGPIAQISLESVLAAPPLRRSDRM
jgi:heptosyltransferase-3